MRLSMDWWFSRIPRPQDMLIALHRLCLELLWQVTLFRTVISASAKRSGLTQLQLSHILRSLTHLHTFCHSKLRKHMNKSCICTLLCSYENKGVSTAIYHSPTPSFPIRVQQMRPAVLLKQQQLVEDGGNKRH